MTLKDIVRDMLAEHKQKASYQLANRVVRKAPRLMKAKNLGRKTANFFVLRNNIVPSILIEVGYLTNTHEEKMLSSSIYRQHTAEAIAESILDYAQN